MSLLARLFDPHRRLKSLPPPHPSARVYDFAQTIVLLRNHETAVRMSRELHQPQRSQTA